MSSLHTVEHDLPPGPVEVVLRHPVSRSVTGRWRFPGGGRTLGLDVLGDATTMCRVDGAAADDAELDEEFIAWPRLVFEVNGTPIEVVSRDPEVLRRHYSRPHHQEESYAPGPPDPYMTAFHHARLAQARRLLGGVHGKVLDAGSGYSLLAMAGPWPFALFACDRDAAAVRNMHEQGAARAVVASAESLPYAPGTFDAVYAGEIVEHLLEPDAALRQWLGAVRPGGRLVVTTPNRLHLTARLQRRCIVKNAEHLFEYSRAELVAAVRRAGGHVDHIEGLILPVPVFIPGRGWRELVTGLRRRVALPAGVYVAAVRAGRFLPSLAENLAIVATPR
jgi:SAM-dependent methyltransferase